MRKYEKPIPWMPVDSRLFGPFLSFGHVRGAARVFLQMEIVLSVAVVIGTLAAVFIRMFPLH